MGEVYQLGAFLIGVLGIVGTAWWRIQVTIEKVRNDAMIRADAAASMASVAMTQLAEHKVHTAEHYVSKSGLREVRDEIMGAMRDIKGGVEHLGERVDRVIEGNATRRTSRRPNE